MIIFKILRIAIGLLPWLLLAVLIYALWPVIQFLFGIGHGICSLFR